MNIEEQKKKRKKTLVVIAAVVCGALLVGCLSCFAIGSFAPDEPAVVDSQQVEETPALMATPRLTKTPRPTFSPQPTAIPTLTPTPRPTRTPQPTALPTPRPEIEVLTGVGDAVLDIDFGGKVRILHITGNATSSHFAVKSFDGNNEQIDLLVNTTDPYDGARLLDKFDDDYTKRLLVTATGEWMIEVIPFGSAESWAYRMVLPGTRTGKGDCLIFYPDQDPDIAMIDGNAEGRHFAVRSYSSQGVDLLVNTTEPYEGNQLLAEGTFLLEITATGPWTITVTER